MTATWRTAEQAQVDTAGSCRLVGDRVDASGCWLTRQWLLCVVAIVAGGETDQHTNVAISDTAYD